MHQIQPILIALFCWSLASVASGAEAEPQWHQANGARWRSLEVPPNGKTGFTLLAPQQTGLIFTNELDEASAAANRILENGSGVAVGDFNGDGRPDIFLCSLKGQNALFANRGNWRFENVTASSIIDATNQICRGAVFADIDGDSRLDLLMSTLGNGVLCFRNLGDGKFTNVTASAGTRTGFGSTTLALADIDGNGTLDLYVANYRAEDIRDRSRVDVRMVNGKVEFAPALQGRLLLTPDGLREFGEPDILYLNDGRGHFQTVDWTSGRFLNEQGNPLASAPLDWGLSASFRDMNGDGWPDLYVCNDYWTPDRIWINDGAGRFRAAPSAAIRHTSENSMGVDFADIDRDGHVDFFVMDMLARNLSVRKRQALAQTRMPADPGEILNRPQIMSNTLFHNRGDNTFEEIADFARVSASDWSWQPLFFDVDLDGYPDLIISAGHRLDIQDLDATVRIKALQHPWPRNIDRKILQEAFTREMIEHNRIYPQLENPIVAFRNLGNLRFEDVTGSWGTAQAGVHQGFALADFDGDGDLDFVVNNLNGPCGIYRNDSTSARVAVRLKGISPNTQAIGAKVTLIGGAIPAQTEEIVSGGRYLSGSDPMAVFGTGRTRMGMTLQVTWRNAKSVTITNVAANRLYEIDEASPTARSAIPVGVRSSAPVPSMRPIFEDVSGRIQHTHTENTFDDFERQPLMPRKLSQLGPGICWADLRGKGRDDLVIGSGKGGQLTVFYNDGSGNFEKAVPDAAPVDRDQTTVLAFRGSGDSSILVGNANYEDGLRSGAAVTQHNLSRQISAELITAQESSSGPLALADIDGGGSLVLFVGGRVIPGRYPESASSQIYRQLNGRWQIDEANTRSLGNIGLVSGAVWSDLDGDGFPELILACEWGPIRIFKNSHGQLSDATAALGLQDQTGWWAGITTGDIDGDGRLDVIATNWGLNSPCHATPAEPLALYFGDFTGAGGVEMIEAEFDSARRALVPLDRLDFLGTRMPFLFERFGSFTKFSEATMDDVLKQWPARASVLTVRNLASTVFLNRTNRFEALPLPREAQFAPSFGVVVADFNGDGREDLFLAQNFFALPWERHRLDAGRGLLLCGSEDGQLRAVAAAESGLAIDGEQRGAAAADFDADGRMDLAVAENGAATKLFHNTGARPGLRVRLKGPPGNPDGIGATLRLKFGKGAGPAREIHAGSGYWSQDSAVTVMALPEKADQIWSRWPGGKEFATPLPENAREIELDASGRVRVIR